MAWAVLIVAGLFEAAWAVAMKESHGFTRLWPTAIFAVTALISMVGLSYAMRDLPAGPAYAVWTGIGAALTATIGMIWLGDGASVARVAGILLILTGVVTLNLAGGH